MDGLYAMHDRGPESVHSTRHSQKKSASGRTSTRPSSAKTRPCSRPTATSIIDLFIRAAQKAGPGLSTDSFVKSMDTMTVPPDIFGTPEQKFTPTKHLGSDASRLSQLQDGKWKVVSDYFK
jgi:branched-chain amino acid transport system substrate-binding protein